VNSSAPRQVGGYDTRTGGRSGNLAEPNGNNAIANTGSGGGAAGALGYGGNGSEGIVIIRYVK
jgi:hypothetical protein